MDLKSHSGNGIRLSTSALPYLEAFSGNGLYCERGMPTMNNYKTVKEVCALTGLTRKHLYYFHHAKVVQAVAHANYSVDGHDGYKLYDDQAVEKLLQIAFFYKLGLKRNEIRDLMLSADYDSYTALEHLLDRKQKARALLDGQIFALEHIRRAGAHSGLTPSLIQEALEHLTNQEEIFQQI